MKVKLKNKKVPLPRYDSFCGLHCSEWEKLNSGKMVKLEEIPKLAGKYLKEVKDGD